MLLTRDNESKWVSEPQGLNLESMKMSKVKLPEIEIGLGWVTFLALDFSCTLPIMVHPIIMGVFGRELCGNLGACPWGDRCQLTCLRLFKMFHFCKEIVVLGGPIIVVMPI